MIGSNRPDNIDTGRVQVKGYNTPHSGAGDLKSWSQQTSHYNTGSEFYLGGAGLGGLRNLGPVSNSNGTKIIHKHSGSFGSDIFPGGWRNLPNEA
jgi:hypothetical protein